MSNKNTTVKQKKKSVNRSVKLLFSPKSEKAKKTEKILEQHGVRVVHLTPTKAPDVQLQDAALQVMQSPEGSRYRVIQDTHLGTLAKGITPQKEHVKIDVARVDEAVKKNIHLHANLEPMVQVQEIDRETIINAKKKPRTKTTAVMKKSANELLLGQKSNLDTQQQIDWCHLIGHQFEGATSSENLAPGTHRSNLNALHGIENPVAKCVKESSEIESIEATVFATFVDMPVIPRVIEYNLEYKTSHRSTTERFFINSQSLRPISQTELEVTKVLRKNTLEDGLQEESTTDLSSAFKRS